MHVSKKEKLLNRLKNKPKDFEYDELRTLLNSLGYVEDNQGKTSGSRVAFVHKETGKVIRVHKPHPGSIIKMYALEKIIEALKSEGVL